MNIEQIKELKRIINTLPSPPGEEMPIGASQQDIIQLEKEIGFALPEELLDWLQASNGPCVGAGGITGVRTKRNGQDIAIILSNYPSWKEKHWIPIAGDGCGNYYVMLADSTKGSLPLGFVDTMRDRDSIAFIAASNLWHFLNFYLKAEQGERRWPFKREFVVEMDPDILEFTNLGLPWDR